MDSKLRSRDWAELTDLILDLIFQKLSSISNCVRFSAVCKPWFSYVSKIYDVYINSNSIEELPRLMILEDKGGFNTITSSYNVINGLTSYLNLPIIPSTWRCCGSSYSWLVFQTPDYKSSTFPQTYCYSVTLLNPFSSETRHLPSLMFDIKKIILSQNPSTSDQFNNIEVVALKNGKGRQLAILKPGSRTWIYTSTDCEASDMICYNDSVYAVSIRGAVISRDTTTFKSKEIVPPMNNSCVISGRYYLVKSTSNDLLRIHKSGLDVKISKLVSNPSTNESMFVDVDNYLGDEALFLSDSQPMSFLASKFPGCKGNSIYYMEQYGAPFEKSGVPGQVYQYYMGIIDLKKNIFQRNSYGIDFSIEKSIDGDDVQRQVLWIIPTPKFNSHYLK